jgi:hypothetical protein
MTSRYNTREMVMRRDQATGMTQVGWASDLPRGRYEHLALIFESASHSLSDSKSEEYQAWQSALLEASRVNQEILEQQTRANQEKGWLRVPFDLAENPEAMLADSVGSYAASAMQLQYYLTKNQKEAWAVILQGTVVHVRRRFPKKQQDELTDQVWYHKQINEMSQLGGTLFEGELMVCESGLWFRKMDL